MNNACNSIGFIIAWFGIRIVEFGISFMEDSAQQRLLKIFRDNFTK